MNGFNEDRAVAYLAEIVALECGAHPKVAQRLRTAAALHDIGKIKLPDNILNKPGKLTAQEFEVVKTHTRLGAELLISIQGEVGIMARMIALYHHEFWNGGGYHGRYACDLPGYISYVSVCDVFVALVSERVYKHSWPPQEALAYIESQAGPQFSPALVRVFVPLVQNDSRVKSIFGEVMKIAGRT